MGLPIKLFLAANTTIYVCEYIRNRIILFRNSKIQTKCNRRHDSVSGWPEITGQQMDSEWTANGQRMDSEWTLQVVVVGVRVPVRGAPVPVLGAVT